MVMQPDDLAAALESAELVDQTIRDVVTGEFDTLSMAAIAQHQAAENAGAAGYDETVHIATQAMAPQPVDVPQPPSPPARPVAPVFVQGRVQAVQAQDMAARMQQESMLAVLWQAVIAEGGPGAGPNWPIYLRAQAEVANRNALMDLYLQQAGL